jgi:tetratricopeptide (TPR) repeat protein
MPNQHVPPAVPPFAFPFTADGNRPSAYQAIEEELPKRDASLFQQLLHEVQVWVVGPLMERRILGELPDTGFLPARLVGPVERTFELLREDPDEHTPDAIVLGLVVLADWAEENPRRLRTAIVFYQATLLVAGENIPVVNHIARLLRRLDLLDDAEAWFRFTADQAAAAASEHRSLALSGVGNIERARGNLPEASRLHRRALETAREHGLQQREGDTLYDLAVIAFQHGDADEGIRYAQEAIPAYGRGNFQLVRMAHDLAWLWMHLHGQSRLALQIFQKIERCLHDPPLRAVLLAQIARAAAEEGAAHIYELAWMEAYVFMRKQDDEEGHAAALSQLALAALASMQLERARQTASLAFEAATRRQESRLAALAEQILNALEDGLPEPEEMRALFPSFSLEEHPVAEDTWERDEDFAAALTVALRTRLGQLPESPIHDLTGRR